MSMLLGTIYIFSILKLIEWCTLRCDQLDGDPKEVSPIFTQFLECVWQLTEQFPQVCRSVSSVSHMDLSRSMCLPRCLICYRMSLI